MPATDLERLLLTMNADFKAYERAWAKAQGTTAANVKRMERDANAGANRIQASMDRAGKALAGFGKGLAIGAVFALTAGLTQLIAKSVSSAAAVGDLSDKLGISTAKLQELQYGAVQANMDFDELEKGLLKFNKALGQAQNGSGDLRKILLANGFSEAQIQALNYSQALDVVAELIKNARNESDAFLINTAAFGKNDAFVEFLKNGKQGLDDFKDAAHRADAVIKDELIRNAQVLDDAWAAVMRSMQAQTATFVLNTVSEFQKLRGLWESLPSLSGVNFNQGGGRYGMSRPGGTRTTPPSALAQSGNIFSEAGNAGGRNYTYTPPKVTNIPNPEADAAAKKASDERVRAYEREQKAITGVMSALSFENDQLKRSELQQRINNELRSAGVTATSEQGKAIADLVTKNFELEKSQEAAIEGGKKYIEAQEQLQSSLMSLAELGVDAFDAIAIGGEKAADVLKNMVKQLASAAIQAALLGQGPLAGLFGTTTGGGLLGSLISGFRAGGGPVSAGKSYVVGEKRPEIFTPSTSGTISSKVPSGGQQITFAPIVDARGASVEAVDRLAYQLDELSRNFANNVKSVVTREKALNSRFAT